MCSDFSDRYPEGKRRVVVLGSTGSIGTQTLDVIAMHPDKLTVVGLAANTNADLLARQARDFDVAHLALGDAQAADLSNYQELFSWAHAQDGFCGIGKDAVLDLARMPEADIVVNALVGEAGMRASYETLAAGHVLALANKESLVVGGDLIMPLAERMDEQAGYKYALMPIDSEHGAIFQCLLGENASSVSRLWITASGGPFFGKSREELISVTPEEALAHPTWHMGAKISIDSATLMNKGLEIIEAHHLFKVPYENIEVVVQPQSIIHSLVEFVDGSVKAQLGKADMRVPIQFALTYPSRWESPVEPLDFRTLGTLDFAAPDVNTFRCLALARMAADAAGTMPAVMNAANEVAVAAFLARNLSFLGIADCVEATMEEHDVCAVESLEQLEEVDRWARARAQSWIDASAFSGVS